MNRVVGLVCLSLCFTPVRGMEWIKPITSCVSRTVAENIKSPKVILVAGGVTIAAMLRSMAAECDENTSEGYRTISLLPFHPFEYIYRNVLGWNEEEYNEIAYGNRAVIINNYSSYNNHYRINRTPARSCESDSTRHRQSGSSCTGSSTDDTSRNHHENWRNTIDDDTSNAYGGLGNPWDRDDSDD